ncbi:MAG TPA: DoxX family protein [Polyangiaceae bacterium]|jgi:hypothetical protein|nr:DoxX family protein [Polyangiaceae bacterium]
MATQQVLNSTPPIDPAASDPPPALRPSALRTKIGWALTGLPCAMVFAAGAQKLVPHLPEPMIQGMRHMGIELSLARTIGIIEVVVVALCLVPRTAFIGAILFTGWAGGAIMTHLRVGEAVYVQVFLAIAVWIGLALRRPAELGSLLGFRRGA